MKKFSKAKLINLIKYIEKYDFFQKHKKREHNFSFSRKFILINAGVKSFSLLLNLVIIMFTLPSVTFCVVFCISSHSATLYDLLKKLF